MWHSYYDFVAFASLDVTSEIWNANSKRYRFYEWYQVLSFLKYSSHFFYRQDVAHMGLIDVSTGPQIERNCA